MKSSDEIKKGLWCCTQNSGCDVCPYRVISVGCRPARNADALALIQQLQKDKDDLLEERELNDFLRDKVKQLEAERDAAVSELVGTCEVCRWEETAKCASCHFCEYAWNAHESNWEWRGVQKEE